MLKNLNHPNIVKYYGYKQDQEFLYIYMEQMSGGSISSMLKQYGSFDEEVIKIFVKQIVQGLSYLHSLGVVHRDIKGANILSNGNGIVKLADFGAARIKQNLKVNRLQESEFCESAKGSLFWMAPEVIKQETHGRKSDIWSLGCTIIEMASGKHPWDGVKNRVFKS
ncbi:hypothetical protein IMG5_189670 [Ichthyophthirius multifiliis]|uniref:Protein kinase domain-containing protein n=1 Tax=Ichthyophthirius multifiliis TaxID=5932 RepID=G0R446_ICHMU|nr:hypothetical protein IMG5_189670 [Ichthyophthirius multifiliis]EGR27766.1 hypothetical protein IMG5_189670 [Ichthyophthirius multifiliis]|eukprot:XP_004025218.1 hypothetical protein IMG5_189670 [Ichthyophthirius multifiliis]